MSHEVDMKDFFLSSDSKSILEYTGRYGNDDYHDTLYQGADAEKVFRLMNQAVELGKRTKSEQIKRVLDIRS